MKNFYSKMSIRKKLLSAFIAIAALTMACSAFTAATMVKMSQNWSNVTHNYVFAQGYAGEALTELTLVDEYARMLITSTDPAIKQSSG